MKNWFSIQNKKEAKAAEIYLYDYIGGFGISASTFVSALNQIDKKRDLMVNVQSRGGDVDEGLAIYDSLATWQGNVTFRVVGLAASIASVIICPPKARVEMPRHSSVMIHNAWGQTSGDAAQHRNRAEWLEKITNQIIDIYAAKTGKSKEEIKAAMDKETLLTAAEAKEFGFCDVLMDDETSKAAFKNFCPAGETPEQGNPEGTPTPPPNPTPTMKKLLQAMVEAKLITSAELSEDAAVLEFHASWKNSSKELTDAKASLKNANDELGKIRDAAADAAIAKAVSDKKIKDEANAKAFWKNAFKADAVAAQAALDAIEIPTAAAPAAPALAPKARGVAPVPPQKNEGDPNAGGPTGRARMAKAIAEQFATK